MTAGVMGLMQPLTSLLQSHTTKILHLTSLNPHVGTVVGAAVAGSLVAPRQSQARAAGSHGGGGDGGGGGGGRQSAGTSSFAFQGTNVHAILTADPDCHRGGGGGGVRSMTLMDRVRHWPAPHTHPLISRAIRVSTASSTASAGGRGVCCSHVTSSLDLRA